MKLPFVLRSLVSAAYVCFFLHPAPASAISTTISRTSIPPTLDGRLDDETWRNITPVTGFAEYYPEEGAEPEEATELYLTFDENNIYVAFRCFDSRAAEIRATMTRRDGWENDDCVGFAIDTYNAAREGYLFNVNPYGIPNDFIWHHDGFMDSGWDSEIRTAGLLDEQGYSIEAAVPFSSLRMPDSEEQVWRFYALRNVKRKGAMYVWPPRTREIHNLLAQGTELHGISGIEPAGKVVLIPYIFAADSRSVADPPRNLDAGFDLRLGLTPSVLFDLTVNPDYSQIEADPDRIELSERYARRFPEKRPFFTEGTDIFATHQALLYTRAIENPVAGLKLTGKAGSWRFGLLSALDDNPDDGGSALYTVGRAKAELSGESSIGSFFSSKDYTGSGDCNRVGSVDAVWRFRDIYSLKGQISGSRTMSGDYTADALGMNANFEHFGADMYNSVWGSDFPGNFEAHAGSMWEQIGVREVGTHNGLFFRNPTSFLNIFEIHGGMKFHFDDEWRSEEEYFWTSVEGASDIIWSKLSYNWNHEIVNEKDLKFGSSTLESWGNPWSNLEYYGSLTLGNAPCYDEGITGWRSRVIGGLALKPVPNLVYNFNLTREDFYREYEGPLKYIQTVAWNKLSFQVRSAMFLRGIYQYNRLVQYGEETTGNSASILFEWEYSPLSNLYIGTNFLDFAELKDLTGSWEVFLKLGYFWRP